MKWESATHFCDVAVPCHYDFFPVFYNLEYREKAKNRKKGNKLFMMRDKEKQGGFTLAELLIVVAIIAVLVAIAIPVFTSQLEKARLAVDHSAMRDAYALVQIANNLQEVEIDGTVKTFDQLDKDLKVPYMLYYLSKDCSSLVTSSYVISPDLIYKFREDGVNSSGICQTCKQWDNDYSLNLQPSEIHQKDWSIGIVYDKATHQLYLGYKL